VGAGSIGGTNSWARGSGPSCHSSPDVTRHRKIVDLSRMKTTCQQKSDAAHNPIIVLSLPLFEREDQAAILDSLSCLEYVRAT
jgi:hypothetical protein